MNFNRFSCFFRALKRAIVYKGKTRESMSNGCDEKFDWEFIRWILKDGRDKDHHKRYQKIIDDYKEKMIIISRQKELDDFMLNMDKNLLD